MRLFLALGVGATAVAVFWWLSSGGLSFRSAALVEPEQAAESTRPADVNAQNVLVEDIAVRNNASGRSHAPSTAAGALASSNPSTAGGAAVTRPTAQELSALARGKALYQAGGTTFVDELVSAGLARSDAESIIQEFMHDVALCPEDQRPPRADLMHSPCYLDAAQGIGLLREFP